MNYLDRIDSYKEEMIGTLQELIAIPGVAGAAEGDAPFGKDVQRALDFMLEKGRQDGFIAVNVDNHAGHLEFYGNDSGKTMGILAHLDVVPAGEGWERPPFGGQVEDGRIYGRGTSDDKGPLLAAYFAMKALKEESFVPDGRIRLILGLDEEAGTGWQSLKAYFKEQAYPDFGFTPDADFPVIHAEMGILIFDLVKKIGKFATGQGVELSSLTGGNAPNMVADRARAVIQAPDYTEIKDMLADYREETGHVIKAKGVGKGLEILAEGVSSHGARPGDGVNAISILLEFFSRIRFANEDVADFIEFYKQHIGFDLHGERIGCSFSDEVSGKLLFNVGKIQIDQKTARLTVNIRYPVTGAGEAVYEAMAPALDRYGFGVVKLDHQLPIFIPEDDPLIVTLMEVYRRHSGDLTSPPMVIGGGTYARAAKNVVAFGMSYPGQPVLAHQKDESVSIDELLLATKIYAEAIYELTKPV